MDNNGTAILTKSEGLCKVCGDKASGKHYGVASCDGCRGFFKRSIRRNLEYVCKENGRCIVDVTRRNQCQACRFKKCLQVNMKRDAVQHERAPRAPQPTLHPYPGLCFGARLRGLHPAGLFAAFPLHHQALDAAPVTPLPTHPLHPSLLYPGLMTKPMDLLASGIKFPSPCIQKQDYSTMLNSSRVNMNDDEVTSSEEALKDKITLEESQENRKSILELPLFNDGFRSGMRSTEALSFSLFPAENIYESAAKLLFLSIKWVKTIPSFLQLPYRDQSILLEESWSELFVLTAAQWSLSIDEALLVSNAVAPSTRHSCLKEDARKLRDIITRLTLLRVDHTEHACLKALVLFKPESRGLCEPSRIELLQDQTHVMLHEYCNQRQTSPKGRFGKLLLTLPAIKAVTRQSLEELLFRQTVGNVSIDKLLGDLAKVTH